MPITLGDAIVYIRGDKTPLAGELAAAQEAVRGAAGDVQGSADEMGRSLAAGFGAGEQAAGEFISSTDRVEEALGDVENAAGDTGGALADLDESTDFGDLGGGLRDLFHGLGVVNQVTGLAKKGAELYAASISRLAESGNKDAQELQRGWERLGNIVQGTFDRLNAAALDNAAAYADAWGDLLEAPDAAQAGEAWDRITQPRYAQAIQDQGQALRDVGAAVGGLAGQLLPAAEALGTLDRSIAPAPVRAHADDIGLLARNAGELDGIVRNNAGAFGEWASAVGRANFEAGTLTQQIQALALAQIGGVLAIGEFGRQMDETFARGVTADNVGFLVQGLQDATTAAQELGSNIPAEQLDDLRGRAGKVRDALAGLNLTPAERAALEEWLNIINGQLADIKTSADNAKGAIGGMAGAGVGRGAEGAPGGGEPIANAAGGTLWEPVVGVGQESGRTYVMGEAGPESIAPLTRSAGAPGLAQGISFNFFGPVYAQSPDQARARGEDMAYGLRLALRAGGVA